MIASMLVLMTICAPNSQIQVVPNVDQVYGVNHSGDNLDLVFLGKDGKWSVIKTIEAKGAFDFPKPLINCSGDSCEVICIGASPKKDSVELIRVIYNKSKDAPRLERIKVTSADHFMKAGITGSIWLISGVKLGVVIGGCYFGRDTSICYPGGLINLSQGAFMGRDENRLRFIAAFPSGIAKYIIPDSLRARDVRDVVANMDSGEILTSKCVVSLPSLQSEECLTGDWRYAYGGLNGAKLLAINLKRDSVMLLDRNENRREYYTVPRPVISVVYRDGAVGAVCEDSVLVFSQGRVVRHKNRCKEGEVIFRFDGRIGTIQCSSTGQYEVIQLNK